MGRNKKGMGPKTRCPVCNGNYEVSYFIDIHQRIHVDYMLDQRTVLPEDEHPDDVPECPVALCPFRTKSAHGRGNENTRFKAHIENSHIAPLDLFELYRAGGYVRTRKDMRVADECTNCVYSRLHSTSVGTLLHDMVFHPEQWMDEAIVKFPNRPGILLLLRIHRVNI